jgi:hypothetical protein
VIHRFLRCHMAPLTWVDGAVLLVATASVVFTFRSTGGIRLRPLWSFSIEDHKHAALLPAPVIADIDGDGLVDIVVATADGRLLRLAPAFGGAAQPPPGSADEWRALPVLNSASLCTHTGLTAGRWPMALQAGLVREGADSSGRVRQIIVAITEDWSVLAFDHELRLLWEQSLAVRSSATHSGMYGEHRTEREVAVTISPQALYTGDVGAVFIAGHAHPPHGATATASAGARAHEGDGGRAGGASVSHFDYFALDGGRGDVRWAHTARDFHHALHGSVTLSPQMDYRLDLDAVGGEDGGLDARHDGERPWHLFREAILQQLPHTWRHPHDTALRLAHFERTRRPAHASRRAAAAAAAAAAATGGGSLTSSSSMLSAAASAAVVSSSARAPNVLVSRRRHGLEVLHLYTGRTLTQMPLGAPSAPPAAHADIDGDGVVDHVASLSATEAARLEGAAAVGVCLGVATSGIPVAETLWNASACSGTGLSRQARRRRDRPRPEPLSLAAPLIIEMPGGTKRVWASVFFASNGRLTAVSPSGATLWTLTTGATWLAPTANAAVDEADVRAPAAFLANLRLPGGGDTCIVAVGTAQVAVASVDGVLLASTRLPHRPIAPPIVADFTTDGVADLTLPTERGYLGLRVAPGAGSAVSKMAFAFVGLAVTLVALVRGSEWLE